MKLIIKNMVCDRCVLVVKQVLTKYILVYSQPKYNYCGYKCTIIKK